MDVSIDLQDDLALITLDDGKKNAITQQALADLNVALDKAEADAKAVVLAGRPGSFCAGFHLPTMTGGDTKAILSLGQGRRQARAAPLVAPEAAGGGLHRSRLHDRCDLAMRLRHAHRRAGRVSRSG